MRARPGRRGAGQHSSPGSGGQRSGPSLRPPGSSSGHAACEATQLRMYPHASPSPAGRA